MATANELIDTLLVDLRGFKSDSHIVIPLISTLETIKFNPDLSDDAKKSAMHEAVIKVYSNEYVHTRTKGMVSGSNYSDLTKEFHNVLLAELDKEGKPKTVKLDGLFEGDAKEGAGKSASQDTRIFASVQKAPTLTVSDKDTREKIHRIVDSIFTQTMTEAFLGKKYSKQTFVNANKEMVRLGEAAITRWNANVASRLGSNVPKDLIIHTEKEDRSEKQFAANFKALENNTDFINTVKEIYWPQILVHLLVREERPKTLDNAHKNLLDNLTTALQKHIDATPDDAKSFAAEKFHTLVAQAYISAFLDADKTKSEAGIAYIDKVLKTFQDITQSKFLDKGQTFSYQSMARSVKSSAEMEILVKELFQKTADIFAYNQKDGTRTFTNAQLFVQAIGPEAIKSWNQKAANVDPQHEQFPNLFMNRQNNSAAEIGERWKKITSDDFADLQRVLTIERGPGISLATGSSLARSSHVNTTFHPAHVNAAPNTPESPKGKFTGDQPPPLLSQVSKERSASAPSAQPTDSDSPPPRRPSSV